MDRVHKGNDMPDINVEEEMVLKKLKKLKANKSAGPDGLHPRLLKEIAKSICKPLTLIYNKSIQEGKTPDGWKKAHVTALHKKGSKQEAKNYRPISLTSICCKMLEAIVRDNIIEHMLENNLFADQQHGFVPKRSCMTQLLYVIEDWTRWLDNNESIDTIFLDFQKAFDSVPHQMVPVCIVLCKTKFHQIMSDTWKIEALKKPKLRTYLTFKENNETEPYVQKFMSRKHRSYLAQFRCGILPLDIETGRWVNKPVESRLCQLCSNGDIEDETHVTFECTFYDNIRNQFRHIVKESVPDLDNLDKSSQLKLFMESEFVNYFARFVTDIMSKRNQYLFI